MSEKYLRQLAIVFLFVVVPGGLFLGASWTVRRFFSPAAPETIALMIVS